MKKGQNRENKRCLQKIPVIQYREFLDIKKNWYLSIFVLFMAYISTNYSTESFCILDVATEFLLAKANASLKVVNDTSVEILTYSPTVMND